MPGQLSGFFLDFLLIRWICRGHNRNSGQSLNELDVFKMIVFHDQNAWDIEVFYDGKCPLCTREIKFLMKRDKKKRIRFTNIEAEDFSAEGYGKTKAQFLETIHGRLPDGQFITGIEVFAHLYRAIGWSIPSIVMGLPIIRNVLQRAYAVFARHRLKFTGRCSNTCESGNV
jgi:predicted DCC family thiol-disulfide oxidoreductase YuxK